MCLKFCELLSLSGMSQVKEIKEIDQLKETLDKIIKFFSSLKETIEDLKNKNTTLKETLETISKKFEKLFYSLLKGEKETLYNVIAEEIKSYACRSHSCREEYFLEFLKDIPHEIVLRKTGSSHGGYSVVIYIIKLLALNAFLHIAIEEDFGGFVRAFIAEEPDFEFYKKIDWIVELYE